MGIPLDKMIVWHPLEELGGNRPEALRKARIILWKGYCSGTSALRRSKLRASAASIPSYG